MSALSGWFVAIVVTLAVGLVSEVLYGAAYPFAHTVALLLVKLLLPGLFLSHLASDFFPPQQSRIVQGLVNAGVATLIGIVVAASLVPALAVPAIHTLRIWGYVVLQFGITLGIATLGTQMALNYLRVASGRMRGITLLVMVALAASAIWVSFDIAVVLAVLLVGLRLSEQRVPR